MGRLVRMGIDVGGTFTKAVAIDNETHEIIGKSSVLTTHSAAEGVAKGVITVFQNCMREYNINPEDITFLAHSTTQATNALLEGDVAPVGILALGKGGIEGFLVKRQTRLGDIPLVAGRFIHTYHTYLSEKGLTAEEIEKAIKDLIKQGAQVIVATKAFGVDKVDEEILVQEIGSKLNVPVSAAHEISKLYGLTVRTRSAVVNASILPVMVNTANSTEDSVRKAGIKSPLMIMRGDGGVMSVEEMRKRPALTMLSGPTASVIGALMYLRASDGIYFEVGGTSTNIGVIKNGRPTVKYARIGPYRTYISSLDVRVLGVAGGSMVRVANSKLVDVGPRSAHIAGMGYAAFTPPEEIVDPQVEYFQPRKGDPADYVAIRLANGKRIAITNTCAVNVLGLAKPEWHASGNQESSRQAMEPLAKVLGLSVEETARQILQKATDKLVPVVEELIAEYKLDKDQVVLVGAGGGAASLLPFTAGRMKVDYQIPVNAEVISSIGVALAMVRDVVERVIPNPTADDIDSIKKEAKEAAIKVGADPKTVEVFIEIDTQTQRVRGIALGATELKSTDLLKECTLDEATEIAAKSMSVTPAQVQLAGQTDSIHVFAAQIKEKQGFRERSRQAVRVVDKKGFIKVQRSNAIIIQTKAAETTAKLGQVWDEGCVYTGDAVINPDIFMVIGGHVIDLVGMLNKEQAETVASTELRGLNPDEPIILIGAR